MRRDDGVPGTGRTERPAHHRGVGGQGPTAGGDGAFAQSGETVALENLEFAAVHLLTRHSHVVDSLAIVVRTIVIDRLKDPQS
jgi:hypothetical protein